MTHAQHGRNGPRDLGSRPRRGSGGPRESQVLYEDEAIRVISVSIAPGAMKSRTTIVCPPSLSSIGW